MQRPLDQVSVLQAVSSNVRWCNTICRIHGHAGEFLDNIWIMWHPAPPFYPNVITLADSPATTALIASIRNRIDSRIPDTWAVKDSFCTLDLSPLGFRPLFDATWIGRVPTRERPEVDLPHIRWQKLHRATELAVWEAAWRDAPSDTADAISPRLFLPPLLMDDTIAIIAAYHHDRIVAGAIAQHTDQVIGLSNVFVSSQHDAALRAGCIAAVMDLFPALPIVGYESGDDLAAFLALGFRELGPLRIWERARSSR